MRRALLIFAAVVALDAATKAVLYTPQWAEHVRGPGWQTGAAGGITIAAVLLLFARLRVAGALVIAGVAGNLISALNGPVANPFMLQHGTTQVAFNLADVALFAGAAAAFIAAPLMINDLIRGRGIVTS